MNYHSLQNLNLETNYTSYKHDVMSEFYKPVLNKSSAYNHATGYFTCGILNLMNQEILDFCDKGGQIRLLVSHHLDNKDIENIHQGYEYRDTLENSFNGSLRQLLEDPIWNPMLGLTAALIATGHLDIKVAFTLQNSTLFHLKQGYFLDQYSNIVAFSGSGNMTVNGATNKNVESFEVYCSWNNDHESDRATDKISGFEEMWNDKMSRYGIQEVKVLPFPEISLDLLKQSYDSTDIQSHFNMVQQILNQSDIAAKNKAEEKSELDWGIAYEHQKKAVKAWENNNHYGIFEHCTGAGKTLSAMRCIELWKQLNPNATVLITAPTTYLLQQWTSDIRKYFPADSTLITEYSSSNPSWDKPIVQQRTLPDPNMLKINLATIQTAYRSKFYDAVADGDHLLLIADEMHWLGADQYKKLQSLDAGAKLGLSATPERDNEPEESNELLNNFKGIIDRYEISDAIRDKVLLPYNYYPMSTTLTQSETDDWIRLTNDINKIYSIEKDKPLKEWSRKLQQLCFNRADIAKEAENKIDAVKSILGTSPNLNIKPTDRWLIYCNDKNQSDILMQELKQVGIQPMQYDSHMPKESQAATMDFFRNIGGVLLAIHCLDEGANIPEIDNCIILASSKNKREYIQRRGRILRRCDALGKTSANIYDVLVKPPKLTSEDYPKTLNILKGELIRATTFAASAENSYQATMELTDIALEYNISIDYTHLDGIESWEDSEINKEHTNE